MTELNFGNDEKLNFGLTLDLRDIPFALTVSQELRTGPDIQTGIRLLPEEKCRKIGSLTYVPPSSSHPPSILSRLTKASQHVVPVDLKYPDKKSNRDELLLNCSGHIFIIIFIGELQKNKKSLPNIDRDLNFTWWSLLDSNQ